MLARGSKEFDHVTPAICLTSLSFHVSCSIHGPPVGHGARRRKRCIFCSNDKPALLLRHRLPPGRANSDQPNNDRLPCYNSVVVPYLEVLYQWKAPSSTVNQRRFHVDLNLRCSRFILSSQPQMTMGVFDPEGVWAPSSLSQVGTG